MSLLMPSRTGGSGPRPWGTARTAMSRSVIMPETSLSDPTGSDGVGLQHHAGGLLDRGVRRYDLNVAGHAFGYFHGACSLAKPRSRDAVPALEEIGRCRQV